MKYLWQTWAPYLSFEERVTLMGSPSIAGFVFENGADDVDRKQYVVPHVLNTASLAILTP